MKNKIYFYLVYSTKMKNGMTKAKFKNRKKLKQQSYSSTDQSLL